MILGIGIDILSIARLEGLIQRRTARRLAERICTAREYAEFSQLDHPEPSTLYTKQVRFLSSR